MAEFYTILTSIGQNKIAAAAAGGPLVNITHMAAGDGGGAYYDPSASQTALRAERWRGSVSNVSIDSNRSNWVVVDATVPTEAGGFTIREAGVYDAAGDLIAIGKYPATYKPAPSEGSAKDLYLRMILAVSNTAAVTFTIDPALTLVTRPEYNQFTQRFNTVSRQDVTLQPGLQIIEVAKSAPFSLTSLTGRMLVNLLGRYGGCESLGPWESNVALVQDTTQRTSGMSSFKLTLGAVDAYAGITFNSTPDHYYVVLADVKSPTGGTATLSVQGLASSGSSAPNGSFATHIIRVKANAFFHQIRITFSGASGSVFNLDSVRVYEVSEAEYNALGSMPVPERVAKYPYVDSVKPVRNPYAIRWTDANRTDIAAMLALQTDLYADPLTGANADSVFERDGQYFKAKRWQRTVLDDKQGWLYAAAASGPGYKCVYYGHGVSAVERSAKGVKYDGKILPDYEGIQAPDKVTIDGVSAFVFIPNADSGWGDDHSPSQEEIKAYFMGWKMYLAGQGDVSIPYNNEAAGKAWVPLDGIYSTSGGPAGSTFVTSLPTVPITSMTYTRYSTWTPYELVYQLAIPTVEPIVSEGQLTLNEGNNQVEVGTGIVLRESTKPLGSTLFNGYYINNTNQFPGTILAHRVQKILSVFKNSVRDVWTIVAGNSYGLEQAFKRYADYDTAGAYSVTYLMLDTSPVSAFIGSVADNEKSLLADLVQDVQKASTRLSVVENKKAEKDSPTWITPTLLGGWVLYGAGTSTVGFYKDSEGYVHLKGLLKSGTLNTAIFFLPPSYRPKEQLNYTVLTNNSSGLLVGQLNINTSGSLIMGGGGNVMLSLDGISFLADQ